MTMYVDPPELKEYAARGDPPVDLWPGRTMWTVDIMKASGDPRDWFRFHHRLHESERAWDDFASARKRRKNNVKSGFDWNQILVLGDYGAKKTTAAIHLARYFFGHGLSPNPPKDTDGRREDSGRVGEGATGEMAGRGKGRRHGPATSRPSIRSSAASSHNNDNEATVSPRRPLRYDRPELQASAASSGDLGDNETAVRPRRIVARGRDFEHASYGQQNAEIPVEAPESAGPRRGKRPGPFTALPARPGGPRRPFPRLGSPRVLNGGSPLAAGARPSGMVRFLKFRLIPNPSAHPLGLSGLYAFALPEQLAQVSVVGFWVADLGRAQHLSPQRLRCRVGCPASTMTVSECGCALLPVSR